MAIVLDNEDLEHSFISGISTEEYCSKELGQQLDLAYIQAL